MSETVLIAAFSGRALAQSARRAGYVPLVVDAFGDADTRAAAGDYVHMPDAIRFGFRGKPLATALARLAKSAPSKPIGLVLGSGFEDRPKLIANLDDTFRILGTKAATVAEVKDPRTFFPLLKQLGIAHPETSLAPPDDPAGWLVKRRGAAGGAHIRAVRSGRSYGPAHYFQRQISGTPMSVLAVTSSGGMAMELSRQWVASSARRPFRYGGAAIIDYAETPAQDAMIRAAALLIELLDPHGLVSFDFMVEGDDAYLLEVNPRPGATLDVFDDARGNLFRAHVEAGLGNPLWQQREPPQTLSRAAGLLYADRGSLIAGNIDWPDWAADRPLPGTSIPAETPIATVHANGASDGDAEACVRARLSQLTDLVYTSSKNS